ncbi:MAG: hypothetical protein LC685_03990 [Actinobacteria bacterium]|nr:hypothetical protein [Actinomycetota bacterium]
MSLRATVEKRSGPALVLLTQQHKAVVPLVSVLLLIGGLALPPALGIGCLLLLAAFLGWLTYLSWPVLVGAARAVRLATFVLVLVAAVSRLR